MKINATRKIPKGEHEWVIVEFDVGYNWVPAFWELADILRMIAECEEEKYPKGQGREMVASWAKDAINGFSNKELEEIYKIPNRKKIN